MWDFWGLFPDVESARFCEAGHLGVQTRRNIKKLS